VLSAQSWDLAADFAADFSGGLPQNNPNGPWSYYATDGTTSSLIATNGSANAPGPNTFGVGAGWAETGGVPSYARGGAFGFPASSMAGHGTNRIVWTAPPEADMGAVQLSGFLTQTTFEPARQMRLQIFKNSDAVPFVDISADFVNQNNTIELPTTAVGIEPLDKLRIVVDGSGTQGNEVSTFAAYNVTIEEYALPGDYNTDLVVDNADYLQWQATFGQTVPLGTGADGNGNGTIDAADYTVWQTHLGDLVSDGPPPPPFTPAAIVVQTSGVSIPDGSQLDISTSQTQGLQEAFDYSAQQGWDLFILPGTYTLNAHLDIEELQLRTFRMEDATLNFTSNVTDYGIRFDSTMMVDWYWNGGAIHAPHATHGVLFQPRTPHPLDGSKHGTNGILDSRMHFAVDITAGTHPVTMNSITARIEGTTFHFRNVPENNLYILNGIEEDTLFVPGRTDDPIPFDLFSTAGRVTVVPPMTDLSVGDPATVFKPDGTTLDVWGTQTTGLQEAFDYAGAHNLDVVVFGRGIRNIAPLTGLSLYSIRTTLDIPDMTGQTVRIYAVTFDYPNSISGGTAMTIGDMTNTDFEYTGQLVAPTSNIGLLLKPDDTGITNSIIRVQTTVGSPNPSNSLIVLDSSLQTIEDSEFYFHEVNTAYFAVKVKNPSATTYFRNNYLRVPRIHAHRLIGLQLGESTTHADRLRDNLVDARTNTDGYGAEASVQVWGDFNTINLVALRENQNFGVKFEPGSNNNTLFHGTIHASTQVADYGTNNLVNPPSPAFSSALPGLAAPAAPQVESLSTTAANTEMPGENIEPAIFQDLLLAVPDEDEQAAAIGSDVADQYSRLLRDEVFEGLFEPESIDLDVR